MGRKTEIEHILEDTLTVNQDGVIEGFGEVCEIIDQKIDEYMIEEKELEQITEAGEELF